MTDDQKTLIFDCRCQSFDYEQYKELSGDPVEEDLYWEECARNEEFYEEHATEYGYN